MVTPNIRVAPNAAKRACNLLRTIQFSHPPSCPCHHHRHHQDRPQLHPLPLRSSNHVARRRRLHLATSATANSTREKEYAFEMAASSIRFGPGATREVGMDLKNMGARRVCVVTDVNVGKLDAMRRAVEALTGEEIAFTVFEDVRVEPKDSSFVVSRPVS
jgi:hydroxyacid-oxoacid transhydrogenase